MPYNRSKNKIRYNRLNANLDSQLSHCEAFNNRHKIDTMM